MVFKKNVVLLTDCLTDLTGGAERQIYELGKGLDKKRYNVTIASLECGGSAPREDIEAIGCRLVTFPVSRIYGWSGLREGLRFIRFLKENKIHIVVTYHFSSDVWGAICARLAGVRYILSNRRDMGFWRGLKHILTYKFINQFISRIVVVADQVKKIILLQEGVDEDQIETIYNGVSLLEKRDDEDILRARVELGIGADELVIAHVANLTPVKGHATLIEAMAGVYEKHPASRLVLIGEDRLNGELQILARKKGIGERVLFLGKRLDARQLLDIADICVLPSLSEGMSNAILEYMAAGKPVVATNVGGNPELIEDRVNGFLVEKEDVLGLQKAILNLFGNAELRRKIGETNSLTARSKFSLSRMVNHYDTLFCSFVPDHMKVMHLICSSGFFGAEKVLLTLGDCFHRNGSSVAIGSLQEIPENPPELVVRAQEAGLTTKTFACRNKIDLSAISAIKNYLLEEKVHILHTHNYKSDFIGWLAGRWAGVPVVATAHGFTGMNSKVAFYERIDRFILSRLFDKVVVVTGKMMPGLSEAKKRVIPNGLEPSEFIGREDEAVQFRDRFQFAADDILVGTVGRLSSEKNQIHLLEACQKLFRKFPRMKLVIIGDGPERDRLEKYISNRYIEDRIIMAGLIRDIPPVYGALDIFVLPSLTEGIPMTILEAMTARVPVVASAVGGVPEIIEDGQTGLLVRPNDPDVLAEGIEKLLLDKDLRTRLSENAAVFVDEVFSVENMRKRYEAVYKEILN